MRKFIPSILFLVAVLGISCVTYFIGYDKGFRQAPVVEVRDTIFKRETLTVYEPKETIKYKDKLVFVPVHDTTLIHAHDTTYVALEREHKLYEGENYSAKVSGIDPALDWLKINQQTAYITNTIEKPTPYKWSLSAFGDVGYPLGLRAGLTFDKQVSGPLRWYIQGGYEYNPAYKGIFVQGGVKLEILKK